MTHILRGTVSTYLGRSIDQDSILSFRGLYQKWPETPTSHIWDLVGVTQIVNKLWPEIEAPLVFFQQQEHQVNCDSGAQRLTLRSSTVMNTSVPLVTDKCPLKCLSGTHEFPSRILLNLPWGCGSVRRFIHLHFTFNTLRSSFDCSRSNIWFQQQCKFQQLNSAKSVKNATSHRASAVLCKYYFNIQESGLWVTRAANNSYYLFFICRLFSQ